MKRNYSKHWTVFRLDGAGTMTPVSDFHRGKREAYEWIDVHGQDFDTYYVMRAAFVATEPVCA